MLSAYYERPTIRYLAPDAHAPGPASLDLELTFASTPNKNFFKKFMRTCIEKDRDQASNAKVRENALDRPFKP